MALKIDMSKTYDLVAWDFLNQMMARMGFADSWIQLIKKCISTVSYSVVLNGIPGKVFIPTEGLSTLLRLAKEEGVLWGIKASRRSPQITHLLFADDWVLFGEATGKGAEAFEKVIKEYEICSGQCINYRKSTVFFSNNTSDISQLSISNRLRVEWSNNCEKYLGLSNMIGRKKSSAFQHLKDHIKMKIDSWSTRFLSQGGIKAVLQAIQAYTMGCFLLPKSICEDMEQIIAKFWWQKGQEKRGVHWCAWSNLCKLKEFGGLGFRNFAKFNLALLAKQGWRLIENPKSLLGQTLKAKCSPNSDFLNSELGNLPSYTWKSIWAAKELLKSGLVWRVGNGHNIRIEADVWVPNADSLHINHRVRGQNLVMVANLIDSNTSSWKAELIKSTFSEEDAKKIFQIPLASTTHEDFLAWRGEHTGEYTVRSGYKLLLHGNFTNSYNQMEERKCFKKMWMSDLPSKIIITAWRVISNYLPTLADLRIKRLTNEAACPRCTEGLENREHAFRNCTVTKESWNHLSVTWPENISHAEFTDWFTSIILASDAVHERKKQSGKEVAKFTLQYLQELKDIKQAQVIPTTSNSIWRPLEKGYHKINFDAAVDHKTNKSCSGIIFRDYKGNEIAIRSTIHENIPSGFEAEAITC
ncbi:hypothetical protein CXB51_009002 [Gossypium anomalum]|uniref:Reverse transcriptase zinc-binding domain-containing protein n=1 Tax=Gossypium anomalum TaxID=47600 RepID=A0A8J6D5V1_9ROSI|nr:hypothetical protein CXB51_009002 [Gossypium anomalum]